MKKINKILISEIMGFGKVLKIKAPIFSYRQNLINYYRINILFFSFQKTQKKINVEPLFLRRNKPYKLYKVSYQVHV